MFTTLITGSGRGLGLALTEEILQRPDSHVVAAVRRTGQSEQLAGLRQEHGGRITEVQLDYSDVESIEQAAQICASIFDHLDLLVNCGALSTAGGMPATESAGPAAELRGPALQALFQANVVGPVLTTQKLLPLLRRSDGAAILNISSIRASISEAAAGSIGYSVTKAALNMASRKLAAELAAERIAVISIHPGWMKTRMGGAGAQLHPGDVARDIMSWVQGGSLDLTGQFVDRHGSSIPW